VAASLYAQQPRQPQQLTLHSNVMEEDRRIIVVLPRNYEKDTMIRYPVLYKLDGDNQLGRYVGSIEVLNSIDAMPEMIVVVIPNARNGRERDLTPPSLHQQEAPDGAMGTGERGRGDRFLEFIERELVPHIETNYRTAPERILAGHSRAALLVLHSLLARPGLFQARFMFSAPLTRDENRMIADTKAFLRANRKLQSFLYCNWGEAENPGMNRSYLAMKELFTKEAPKGLRWTMERARGADHQQTPLLALPAALYEYYAGSKGSRVSTPANRTARASRLSN
jgi:predicted alpha/beta superfamily hydrolase